MVRGQGQGAHQQVSLQVSSLSCWDCPCSNIEELGARRPLLVQTDTWLKLPINLSNDSGDRVNQIFKKTLITYIHTHIIYMCVYVCVCVCVCVYKCVCVCCMLNVTGGINKHRNGIAAHKSIAVRGQMRPYLLRRWNGQWCCHFALRYFL